MKVRNTFIIFLVSGFWHGANWTFIVWGGLNALYFLPLLLLKRNRTNLGVVAEGRILPTLREVFQMCTTFILTVFAWIFFRAEDLNQAVKYVLKIVTNTLILPDLPLYGMHQVSYIIITVSIFYLLVRDFYYDRTYFFKNYWSLEVILLLIFGAYKSTSDFIYFQF